MAASTWTLLPTRCLEPEEVDAVLASARGRAARSARRGGLQAEVSLLALRFGLEAGLRATELVELAVADADLRKLATARIHVRKGKGGKSRVIPIRASLAQHVRRYVSEVRPRLAADPDPGNLLLGNGGKPLSRHSLNGRMRTVYRNAGLPQGRIKELSPVHSLRHTCGTILYRKTKDLRLTQDVLGHSRPSVTAVYATVVDGEKRSAIEAAFADLDPDSDEARQGQ